MKRGPGAASLPGLGQLQPESAGRTRRVTRRARRPLQPPWEPGAGQAGAPRGRRLRRPGRGEEGAREARPGSYHGAGGSSSGGGTGTRRGAGPARAGLILAPTPPRGRSREGEEGKTDQPSLLRCAATPGGGGERPVGWAGPTLRAGPAWSRPSALPRLTDKL